MEIFAFDLSDKWIDVNEKTKFKVDYLTPDQSYKLQVLLRKGLDFKIKIEPEMLVNKDPVEQYLAITATLTEEQKAKFEAAWDYYEKFYLKCVIKDWAGIPDGQGKEVKCVLVNDELEEKLWVALCNQDDLRKFLFEEARKKLRFDETDKKKLSFSQDSETKVD